MLLDGIKHLQKLLKVIIWLFLSFFYFSPTKALAKTNFSGIKIQNVKANALTDRRRRGVKLDCVLTVSGPAYLRKAFYNYNVWVNTVSNHHC